MGTSSSFGGATGRTPLLPPWAQGDGGTAPDPGTPPPPAAPPPGQPGAPAPGEQPPAGATLQPNLSPVANPGVGVPVFSWGTAKRWMTAYTSRGDRGSLRNAANRYVGARGGGRTAARAAQ